MSERPEFPHILPEGPDRRHAVLETVDLPAPAGREGPPSPAGPLETQDFSRPAEEVVGALRAPAPAVLALAAPAEWCPLIPGFEVLEELGRGLTGVVYRARQANPDRVVALKVARAGLLDPTGLEALRVEAETLADLDHPHIVRIHEVGETAGQCWLALEYCSSTVARQLDGQPWPTRQAAGLVATLAGAVEAAHARGIVHGDLKPANVLLTEDGQPKITDFGVGARLRLRAGRAGSEGGVIGTPAYMAPEQAAGRNREVGPAADIHALGVLLYELLTGRLPFRAATALETVGQVIRDEPSPPRRLRPDIPPDLEAICLKCLRKAPAERYARARDLAADLEHFLQHGPVADGLAEYLRQRAQLVLVRDVPGQHLGIYRSLVEELRLCVFRKDLGGRYTFVNDRFCGTLGLDREQVLGRTDEDLFTPEFAAKLRRDDAQVLASRAVAENIEEHRRAACGPRCRCGGLPAEAADQEETRWLQVLLAPVLDAEGRPAGTQGAFWDVTPRGRAERQAQEALAELRKAVVELKRSNADLEQFASVASHDLQEPLRNVASFAQLLQQRYQGRLDADADEFIGYVVDGATRMQRLIKDLLLYARVAAPGRTARVSAQQALDDALVNLRAALRESDAQVTWQPRPLPEVYADASQLTQVFQNLIGNAVKFCRGRRPMVHVSARPAGRAWQFAVRDNGIGIKEQDRERIFVLFQQLNRREQYPGTGIGLALCKKIVERHGGRIWVESRIGLGSTFYFTLPGRPDEED